MPTKLQPGRSPDTPTLSTEEATVFWLRTGVIAALFAIAALGIVYFARAQTDYRALFDEQLEVKWLAGRELTDAGEFFAKGGVFENTNDSRKESIDQAYVVPLINRLKEKHGLELQVLLELNDSTRAYALVAEIPSDRHTRNTIRATVLETADEFPGLLYQGWGHRWLTLDFFDELEITPLKQAGVLTKLKASQRRME